MTFRLTEEQLEIRAMARDFARGEIRPFASDWDARRALDPGIFAKLGELGFLGMLVPEEHGGAGLSDIDGDVPTGTTVIRHWRVHPQTGFVYQPASDAPSKRWEPATSG